MLAAGLVGAALPAQEVFAQSPALSASPARFYRMQVGEITVTALSDGSLPSPPGKVPAGVPGQRALSGAVGMEPADATALSLSAYLIQAGGKRVLIDAGAGPLLGAGAGLLVQSLRAAGYGPEQIDDIYISRVAPEQAGGLVLERKPVFPNAVVHIAPADASYLLNKSAITSGTNEQRERFAAISAAFKPYRVAGRLRPIDAGAALLPGLRAITAAGQAPGVTYYVAESRGETMVFCGDALRIATGAAQDPAMGIEVAMEAAAGEPGSAALAEAAAGGHWVGGSRLAFPGIGHLRTRDRGFHFMPATPANP